MVVRLTVIAVALLVLPAAAQRRVTVTGDRLGGFVLPIAFGAMNDLTGIWTSCFMLLFVLVAIALTWMHFAIMLMEKRMVPELRGPKYLPELAASDVGREARAGDLPKRKAKSAEKSFEPARGRVR